MALEVIPTLGDEEFDNLQVAEETLDSLQPNAIGTDVGFDFERGEILLGGSGGQVQVVRGTRTVAQWIMSALSTERGRMAMYPAFFGSGISDAIASGFIDESLIAREVNDTIVQHDRVSQVSDIRVERSSADDETVFASFTVYLNTGDRIRFGKVPVG